jgi:NADH-quinone oxidoreductase subunit A
VLENYLPIIVFIFLGIAFGVGLTVVGYLLGPSNPDDEKNSQFECGFPAFDDSRMHFNIRYYLVAILFVLFDLEVAFFYSMGSCPGKVRVVWIFCHVYISTLVSCRIYF